MSIGRHSLLVKLLTPWQEVFKRVVAGFGSLVVLADTVRSVRDGAFNMHGYAFRRVDHPLAFWLWMACIAAVGLPILWWAIKGSRNYPKI
jgi:hypothetical protein